MTAQGSELCETVNFQNAVKNGTRSRDGKPGPKYRQNRADYNITVRLDTASKRIHGKESITYHNQCADPLTNIVLRLYQDRYKKGAVRDTEVRPGNIHEGMHLDTIIIDETGISLEGYRIMTNGTNLSIPLKHPLPPNRTLDVYCEWSYEIPMEPEFRRTGYYRDKAWFIGYFYPQIAVYDDMEYAPSMKGWDYLLFHTGLQEFYNDFNNYEVCIEVPEGFYVWATGNLTNEKQVYTSSILERLEKARTTDETVKIISKDDLPKDLLAGNKWKFKANGVPDFAFGTANHYLWDGSSVMVDNRRVFVDVAYHPDAEFYPRVIDIARKTVKYTSEEFPGIPYPYPSSTTFNGMWGGGMEFPMIANNCDEGDTIFMILMTFHEICHNYHPFMTGINEKRYHFMDEGLTQLATIHFLWDQYKLDFYANSKGSERANGIFKVYNHFCISTQDNCSLYNAYAQNDDNNVYYQYVVKPVVPLMLFAEMVGEEKFLYAYQEFVRRWEGKHPTPFDLFYTMNDVLGENFNWFWNAWYMDFGYPDMGIELEGNHIIVKRIGARALPLPVSLTIEYNDGTSSTISEPMDIWKNGARRITIEIENPDGLKSVSLDVINVPDIDHSNNYIGIN
ncbi:MAG: hypothetical protein AMS26_01310 [Bacteroides sp. SM23_62]|nr:MAG: hypothetical protein AMS26_01310 [Bacteroides sp. SM23_62]